MNKCPCKGCPDRKGATKTENDCHSYCERHKEWKKAQIEEQRKIRTEQENENKFRSYKVETALKNQKRREHGDKK